MTEKAGQSQELQEQFPGSVPVPFRRAVEQERDEEPVVAGRLVDPRRG